MCAWVLALQNYTEVHRMVLPKQKKCEEAQEALNVARENLQQKRAALKQVSKQFKTTHHSKALTSHLETDL